MKSIHSILSFLFRKSSRPKLSGQHRIFRGEFSDGDRTSYTYLKDATGERIFDGPFKYVYNDIYKQCLSGYFRNNRQVGKWICELSNTEYGHKTLVKTVITVNFNDEGICHGAFTVSEYYRHGKVITTMKANFINGHLEGEYVENNRSRKGGIEKIRGSYRRGQPAGVWRFPEYTVDYDNRNEKGLPLAKIVDDATGDISYRYVEVRNSHYRPVPGRIWGIGIAMQSRNLYGIVKELSMRDSRIAEFKINPESEETAGVLYLGFADFRDVDIKIRRTLPPGKDGLQPDFEEFLAGHFSMTDISDYEGEQRLTVKWMMKPDGTFLDMAVFGGDDRLRNEAERLVRLIKWSAAEYRGHRLFAQCELTLRLNPTEIKRKQRTAKRL